MNKRDERCGHRLVPVRLLREKRRAARASSAVRRSFVAVAAVLLASAAHASEDGPGEGTTRIEALDPAQAKQERPKKMLQARPKPYEDKVMDPGTLLAMTEPDALQPAEQTGFQRFAFETRLGIASSDTGLGTRHGSEIGRAWSTTAKRSTSVSS